MLGIKYGTTTSFKIDGWLKHAIDESRHSTDECDKSTLLNHEGINIQLEETHTSDNPAIQDD